jgi:phospholipid/cholesterol/gamma-HCH transport system permease protein
MIAPLLSRFETMFHDTGQIALLFLRGVRETPSLGRGWRRFVIQLNRVGVDSVPLVLMIGLFTGMVIALQTGIALKENFGAEGQLGIIVGLTLVREMGPVITAFIIAGRVGSAIAAELGTMAVAEEIDALRSMGISPVRYLYVPRLFAMLIMQPVLTVFSVLVGIWGGALVVAGYLNFPATIYYNRVFEAIEWKDIVDGFSKTFVFAALIATISTYAGMTTRNGAEGVGRSTTKAVVVSLTMVLVFDYLMTRFLA